MLEAINDLLSLGRCAGLGCDMAFGHPSESNLEVAVASFRVEVFERVHR